ncbi:hypothetical protein Anapl_00610 [Anas platyrhynchos]|uniref:Uncharacterized protein n=1 Tax=Anas platyrhynchos TaxID=8839 RepID=R0LZW7_ANAPL|nr:hypothetical protein Anapl_00610 [Anas platyrhynchos]
MQEGVKGSKILPGASTGLGHELTTPPVPSVPCAGDRDLPTAPAGSAELQEQRCSKGGAVLGCSWLSCFGLGTILCCLPGFAVAAARRVWMAAALQQLENLKHEQMDFVPHSLERARAELPAILALVWWLLPLFQVLEPSSHSRLLKSSQTLPRGG